MKQTTNTNMNKKADQKQVMKSKKAEANARRKVAKSWALVAQSVKYRKATVKESCNRLTQILEEELFNGILLNLSGRNGMKSYACQKRILRRIVEKRLSQQVHHKIGRSKNRFSGHMLRNCANKSLSNLRSYQICV